MLINPLKRDCRITRDYLKFKLIIIKEFILYLYYIPHIYTQYFSVTLPNDLRLQRILTSRKTVANLYIELFKSSITNGSSVKIYKPLCVGNFPLHLIFFMALLFLLLNNKMILQNFLTPSHDPDFQTLSHSMTVISPFNNLHIYIYDFSILYTMNHQHSLQVSSLWAHNHTPLNFNTVFRCEQNQ